MNKTALFLLFSFFYPLLLPVSAVTKQEADEAYKKGNYQLAIKNYEELIAKKPSSDLYYNLGNAYFRTENTTKAILAYERALQLQPTDKDIRFNLEYARSKTVDKITPESELFFFSWYRSLVNMMSVDGWARVTILAITVVLILLLLYLFANRLLFRQIGFYGAIAFLILFLFSGIFAYQQKKMHDERKGAIVVTTVVNVKKTPGTNGTDAFLIHEGTRVSITDKSIAKWFAIRLDDGREGWIPTNSVEEI